MTKKKTRKKSKSAANGRLKWLVVAAGAVVVLGLVAGYRVLEYVIDNKLSNFRHDAVVYVRPDSSLDEVYAQLINEAGVKRPYSLMRVMKDKQVGTYMQPGRYEIHKDYPSVYVARMLNNCWQSPAKLVLSGTIRKNSQIASKISRQLMIDSVDVIKALTDRELLSSYGFSPKTVFCMFMPDTYEMYWTADMKEVLDRQKAAYDAFWTPERVQKAAAQGLTRKQVSILASIVTAETNYEPEMPKIAGTYLNRLHKGMLLQADPTVAYCLDYNVTRILNKHLEIDSPYNTYKYAGLPPGPICVPCRASLDAVLNPQGDYLYFCANSNFNGTHLFAVSYAEHMRNARAFQAALDKQLRKK